ncbi:lysozyme inhibitor LprI family protein [Halochromatium sp.]
MCARISLLLAFGLAFFCCQVSSAGFDCTKAKTGVEKTICADPALSELDDELTTSYRAALGKTIDANALRASQRSWLEYRRDSCKTRVCLTSVYRDRLQQLKRIAAGGAINRDIAGTYSRLINGKLDPSSAVIKLRPLGGGEAFTTGNATWIDNASGIARTGSFEGTVAIDGEQIDYSDGSTDGCKLSIKIKENSLSVSNDNGQCGGLNVTFDGTYRKS